VFPEYYPEFSREDYHNGLDGNTSSEFTKITNQEKLTRWSSAMGLYMYQIHILKKFTQIHILVTFSKYENNWLP
jgi:hypothetical protein